MVMATLATRNRSISAAVATFKNSVHLLCVLENARGNVEDDSADVNAMRRGLLDVLKYTSDISEILEM